tara:strand:+ start:727 stop:1365 length:639 start_codon:yes stop_codon:yes gene_type:complete
MKKELVKRILSSIVLLPAIFFLIIKGSILFNSFLIICFFISIYEWSKIVKKNLYKLLGILFLLVSFYSIYKIRTSSVDDYLFLLFITTICISTDIGGYIFGKIFKGPKLTKFSPNKTISGMIGAFILSILSMYFFILNEKIIDTFSINIIVFTILISVISQLGDIIVSYFKRLSNIKDTGNIIPGHGGLLDRIDGMIFAFPITYILFTVDLI